MKNTRALHHVCKRARVQSLCGNKNYPCSQKGERGVGLKWCLILIKKGPGSTVRFLCRQTYEKGCLPAKRRDWTKGEAMKIECNYAPSCVFQAPMLRVSDLVLKCDLAIWLRRSAWEYSKNEFFRPHGFIRWISRCSRERFPFLSSERIVNSLKVMGSSTLHVRSRVQSIEKDLLIWK